MTISKYGHDYMQNDRIDEMNTMVVFIFFLKMVLGFKEAIPLQKKFET